MAKMCSTVVLAGAATIITDRVSRIVLGDATIAPTATAAETTANNCIAVATASSNTFTLADSSVSGKKITVAQQATLTVNSTKVAAYVYLISSGATGIIYYRTSCATRAFTSTADRVTIPAWDIHFYDAT